MIDAHIAKSFPGGIESRGFSLNLHLKTAGGVTVLFGPSGSGKTLTLDCIAGLRRPDSGRILLGDQILYDGGSGVHLPPQARRTGYVFQNYALFPHMTLRRNLEFAAERLHRLERHRRVNEIIERFRLSDVAGLRPYELSGGQKQRCSIARALIGEPLVLLLDEPARGLDAPLRTELYQVLRQVRSQYGTPVLLVTHDLDECFELGDQMLIVREGQVVQEGSPHEIAGHPANVEVARLLGLYNLLQAEVLALDPGRNTSRVRYGEFELAGPYYPGKLIGARICLYVRPEDLMAVPRNGRPSPNQIPADLLRVVAKPRTNRLEFTGDIAVEARGFDESVREWSIEFPAQALKAL
ncbi:MAG: ATP-binding cassette domain-containing protein [Acidobacteriota bacterium]|nr:ATP-binding cassette domain-containing protein [Acidobacteriota bacterium]